MRTILLLVSLALPLCAEWKAGVARVDITPAGPIWMAGYASRGRPSEGVHQKLWAKALALEDSAGRRSVIVTSDLLGWTRAMSDQVFEAVRERYGLTRDRLVLNASHTHSGPVTGQLLRPAYQLAPEHEEAVRRYTVRLIGLTTDLIGEALDGLQPAGLGFEQGFAGFAVNRRRVGARHQPGPVDHDVPVMTVKGAGGELRAILFGYACHATVMSDYTIHGDWPGFAQEAIEARYPDALAMFVNGCGADQNPLPRRRMELAQKYGEILAAAVELAVEGAQKPIAGPLRAVWGVVRLPLQPAPEREEFERRLSSSNALERSHAKAMLERLDRGEKLITGYDYPIQVWRFGDSLTFVSLAGEVVVGYSLMLKEAFGWDATWVSGYNNDVFAYIPTARIIREGGYEGATSMFGYGLPAPFDPQIEQRILRKVKDLAATLTPRD